MHVHGICMNRSQMRLTLSCSRFVSSLLLQILELMRILTLYMIDVKHFRFLFMSHLCVFNVFVFSQLLFFLEMLSQLHADIPERSIFEKKNELIFFFCVSNLSNHIDLLINHFQAFRNHTNNNFKGLVSWFQLSCTGRASHWPYELDMIQLTFVKKQTCLQTFCISLSHVSYVDAAYCHRRRSKVYRSVCRSVCHSGEPVFYLFLIFCYFNV